MTAFNDRDREHMLRALELAARGLFTTTPNPRVGCVIVRDERIDRRGLARAGRARRTPRSRRSPPRARAAKQPAGQRRTSPWSRATTMAGRRRVPTRCSTRASPASSRPCATRTRRRRTAASVCLPRASRSNSASARRSARAQHRLAPAARRRDGPGCGSRSPRAWMAKRRSTMARANGSPDRPRAPTGIAGAPALAPSSPASGRCCRTTRG